MEPVLDHSRLAAATPGKQEQPETKLEDVKLPERSKLEVEEMRRRVAVVARVFSNSHDLMMLPAPQGGWAVSIAPDVQQAVNEYLYGQRDTLADLPDDKFRWRVMYYDENHLKTEEEEAIFGFVRHEIGHLHHSDLRLLIEGEKMAMKDGNLPTTYQHLYNALEDVWINLKEGNDSPIAKRQIEYVHRKYMPKVEANIQQMPPNVQLGMNIIHYWLEGKDIPTIKDQRVLDTFKEIEPAVNEYFWGPSARTNWELLWEKIWPAARLLEQQSVMDNMMSEAARQMAKKGRQGGQGKAGAQGNGGGSPSNEQGQPGGGQGKPGPAQPGGGAGGGGQPQQGKGGGSGTPGQGQGQGTFRRMINAARRAMGMQDPKEKRKEEQDKKDQELGKQLEQQAPQDLADRVKRELDKEPQNGSGLEGLSEQTKEELRKFVENLSPQERKQLEQKAREELDKQQAEALKDNCPAGMEVKEGEDGKPRTVQFKDPKTQREEAKAKKELEKLLREVDQEREQQQPKKEETEEDRQRAEESQRAAQKAMQQKMRDMDKAGFLPHEARLYDEFRQLEREVKPVTDKLTKKLENLIPRHTERIDEGDRYSGQRLNREALAKRLPVNDPRIYHDSEWIETERARLYLALLVDRSPSMDGEKIEAARKAAIALGMLAKKFDMPYAIKVFSSDHSTLLDFEHDYDDKKQRVKPRLLHATQVLGSGTNIGDPLRETHQELRTARKQYPDCAGLAFVVSDGGANVGPTGYSLKRLILEMQNEFVVVNFMLSSSAYEVQEAKYYFGDDNVIWAEDFGQLPEEAGKVLCKVFERYMKRFSRE